MWNIAIPAALALLSGSEQRKANSQASDSADKANTANNALRDPALPYAKQNLQINNELQKFYQNNPFNDQQKTGYQNQNNLIDQFNGQVAPGLLGMANGMMGQSYQRQRGGAPGSGAGYGGLMQGGGMQQAPQGLMAGPFSAPTHQNFGQIDFAKMNPFSLQNKADPANATTNPAFDPALVTQGSFNEADYYAANPDILKAGWDRGGWDHFQRYGRGEGRKLTKGG